MNMMHNPAHPGEVLREWISEMNQQEVANALGISRTTLSRVLNGRAGISADVDLRLSEALGTTPGLWVTMQAKYELAQAAKIKRKKIKPLVQNEVDCYA